MPVPFVNEMFVLARDGVEFEIDKIPASGFVTHPFSPFPFFFYLYCFAFEFIVDSLQMGKGTFGDCRLIPTSQKRKIRAANI